MRDLIKLLIEIFVSMLQIFVINHSEIDTFAYFPLFVCFFFLFNFFIEMLESRFSALIAKCKTINEHTIIVIML